MLTLFNLVQLVAYWGTIKSRVSELVKMATESDVKRQKAEDERDALKGKLTEEKRRRQEKEQELEAAQAELKREAEAWQRERQLLADAAMAREGRISSLKTARDQSEEQRVRWKRGYQRVRSLCVDSIRLYQKSTEFKELVAAYSLQSFYEGALALKEYVDERAPGLDYSEAECLEPVPEVEIPEMANDEMLRMLNAVFEGEAEPQSPQVEDTPRTPQDGTVLESAPLPPSSPAPAPVAEAPDHLE